MPDPDEVAASIAHLKTALVASWALFLLVGVVLLGKHCILCASSKFQQLGGDGNWLAVETEAPHDDDVDYPSADLHDVGLVGTTILSSSGDEDDDTVTVLSL